MAARIVVAGGWQKSVIPFNLVKHKLNWIMVNDRLSSFLNIHFLSPPQPMQSLYCSRAFLPPFPFSSTSFHILFAEVYIDIILQHIYIYIAVEEIL